MRATRLTAAAIAAGSMVLGMAGPALATPDAPPKAGQFCKKAELGKTAKAEDGTLLKCMKKAGQEQPHWVAISPGDDEPTAPPTTPKPTFKFGYDKVKLSSRRVAPGLTTTFTVTCPSTVSITSNGYTRNPLPVKKIGKNTWTATGTFRGNLPDPTTATVVCKGFGSVKFSTSPEKGGNNMTPTKPKIPVGRIDTGDGSMYRRPGGSSAPLLAGAWGALTAVGLAAVALRRRTVRS
ncbi:hypothetical protein ACQPZP_42515 [Spirillospora sp. CA-142024]|uniref:hypothetical protein n=1 Tax=Spirillospora sp. CA-142024 TaxID=3240036 RepID=UPI003D8E279F